jgi:phosphotransferase system enzyme I (PtsP)
MAIRASCICAPRRPWPPAFRDKIAMQAEAQERYASIRDKPARPLRHTVSLQMNAGLMADLPSLPSSGAEGVGLFRTELQFLTRNTVPRGPSWRRSMPG